MGYTVILDISNCNIFMQLLLLALLLLPAQLLKFFCYVETVSNTAAMLAMWPQLMPLGTQMTHHQQQQQALYDSPVLQNQLMLSMLSAEQHVQTLLSLSLRH